jgi:hypothetical protein
MVVVQELSDHDMANHSMAAEHLIKILSDNVIILMTDENPQQLHQQPLHNARVTVWCGVAIFGVIGPYFFEGE